MKAQSRCDIAFPGILVLCERQGAVHGLVFYSSVFQMTDFFLASRITTRVRKLLMLIPTDPAVIESLDSISTRVRCLLILSILLVFVMLF